MVPPICRARRGGPETVTGSLKLTATVTTSPAFSQSPCLSVALCTSADVTVGRDVSTVTVSSGVYELFCPPSVRLARYLYWPSFNPLCSAGVLTQAVPDQISKADVPSPPLTDKVKSPSLLM